MSTEETKKKTVSNKSTGLKCLTHEQVETNIKNMCKIMCLKNPKKLFSGKIKPKFEEIEQYNLANLKERAECYELWECENEFYFIVVYSNKFDSNYFKACDWFNHLFKDFVMKVDRPKVYLCYAFVLSKRQYLSIPQGLLKCPYRLVGIPDIHPLTGSPNGLDSYVLSYELLDTKDKAFNGKDFPDIKASDPGVKIVNALPGELIKVKCLYSDRGNVYTTYKIRRVRSTRNEIGNFDKSGIDNFEYEV